MKLGKVIRELDVEQDQEIFPVPEKPEWSPPMSRTRRQRSRRRYPRESGRLPMVHFVGPSDIRLKAEIAPLRGTLERVLKLVPISYRFRSEQAIPESGGLGSRLRRSNHFFLNW